VIDLRRLPAACYADLMSAMRSLLLLRGSCWSEVREGAPSVLLAQEGAARLDALARVIELPRDDGVGDHLQNRAVADREECLDLAAL